MKRLFRFFVCLGVIAALSGCAMSDNCWDDAYSAYGGAVERQDRFHGRVGSVLSDPAMQMTEPGALSNGPTESDLYPEGLIDSSSPEESSQ
jgi:hypothetical protein